MVQARSVFYNEFSQAVKEQIIPIVPKPFQSTEPNGKLCDSFYNPDNKDNTREETDPVPYRSTEESITHSTSKSNLDVF